MKSGDETTQLRSMTTVQVLLMPTVHAHGSLVKIASENPSNDKCNLVHLKVRLLHWQGNFDNS